jgi:hypothetical protein
VTLCVDFFFVQGIAFLHTISRGIGYCTVTPVPDRTHKTISPQITAVLNVYRSRGLNACDIHADNEFECIRGEILPTEQNVLTADSHVCEVERSIRTIKKERLRSCVHGLLFLSRLPKIMITHMVADTICCLNQFPHAYGISTTMSPATIVTGVGTPDYTVICLELGTYAKVLRKTIPPIPHAVVRWVPLRLTQPATPKGTILSCRWPLVPASLATIGLSSPSLTPPLLVSRHSWLFIRGGPSFIQERGFVVEWRPDHTIDDSDNDVDVAPPDFVPDDFFKAADYVPLDPTEIDDLANPFVRFDPAVPNKPPTQEAGADAVVDHDEADFPVDDVVNHDEADFPVDDVVNHDEADFPVDDYNNDVDTAFVDIFDADDEKEGTQGAAPAYDDLKGALTENTDAYHGT